MGHQTIRDARLWIAEYDFSGHGNQCALAYSADAPDDTALQATSHTRLAGGLKDIALSLAGFWEAGVGMPDTALEAKLAAIDIPVSACFVAAAAEGSRAFTFRAAETAYQPGGQIGETMRFSANAMASKGPLVRGAVLHNATRTATGVAGSAWQLGAVGATQSIYAALHVLEVSGTNPTLDVAVASDNASNFPSPATRISFNQSIAVGSQWGSAVGAITDDWWKVYYTLGGVNPSFKFVVVAGIAPTAG